MIVLEPGILAALIGLGGTGILAALSWILRTLGSQNKAMAGQSQALAVLIARVDPAVQKTATLDTAVTELSGRVFRLELVTGLIATPPPQQAPSVTVNA